MDRVIYADNAATTKVSERVLNAMMPYFTEQYGNASSWFYKLGQTAAAGLEKARELQHKSVIVLGHEHYYPKFGFVPADKWNIKSPYDVPRNAFMALELVTDGLKNANGLVKYPKEFDTV